jgi:hypothetical protein
LISPPHAEEYETDSELYVADTAVMGRYVKLDGEIYAYLEISWILEEKEGNGNFKKRYYDDMYKNR